jgi:hypothetical protein
MGKLCTWIFLIELSYNFDISFKELIKPTLTGFEIFELCQLLGHTFDLMDIWENLGFLDLIFNPN